MARIAVIGAGHLGGTLGDTWRRAGHQVTFGVRDPEGRQEEGRRFVSPRDAVPAPTSCCSPCPGLPWMRPSARWSPTSPARS